MKLSQFAFIGAVLCVNVAFVADGINQRDSHLFASSRYGRDYTFASPTAALGAAWLREPIAPAAQFSRVREDIKRRYAASTNRKGFVERFRVAALRSPGDPVAAFKWAIARGLHLEERGEVGDFDMSLDARRELAQVAWLLAEAHPSQDAEYVAARYRAEAFQTPDDRLLPLGKKLVERDPKDLWTLRAYVHSLTVSDDLANQDLVLDYGRRLVELDKSSLRSIGAMVMIYDSRLRRLGRMREDAEQGLAWAHRLKREAPKGSASAQAADIYIPIFEKALGR